MRRTGRTALAALAVAMLGVPLIAAPAHAADTTVTDLDGLKAAVDGQAACASGDTVTLGADIEPVLDSASTRVRISCDATLDLNGHRLAPYSVSIVPGAQVTITDTTGGGVLDIDTPADAAIATGSADTRLVVEGYAHLQLASNTRPAIGSSALGAAYGDIVIRGSAIVDARTASRWSAAVGGGRMSGEGSVTIGDNAQVTATAPLASFGTGIGGGGGGVGTTVTIGGSAHVTAKAHDGAAIGAAGDSTSPSTVIIGDSATVETTVERGSGAGIGSGVNSPEVDVQIQGAATVTSSTRYGAGIGSGLGSSGVDVRIGGTATVTSSSGPSGGIGTAAGGSIVIGDSAVISAESDTGAGIGGRSGAGPGNLDITISGSAQVTAHSRSGGAGIGVGSRGEESVALSIEDTAEVAASTRYGGAVGHGDPVGSVPGQTSQVTVAEGAVLTAHATNSTGTAIGAPSTAGTVPYDIQVDGTLRVTDESQLHVSETTSFSVGADGAILGDPDDAGAASITGPGLVQNHGIIALARPEAPHLVESNSYLVRFQREGASDFEDVWVYAPNFDAGYREFPAPAPGGVWNTLPNGQGAEVTATTDLSTLAVDQTVGGHPVQQVVVFEVVFAVPSTVTVTPQRTPVTVGGSPKLDIHVGALGGATHTGGLEVYVGDTTGDPIATGEIEHGGVATLEAPGLGVGTHDLIVRYLGNHSVEPTDSDPVEVEVVQADSAVSVVGPGEATVGDTVEWNATVRSVEADAAEADPNWQPVVPTGDVQLFVDSAPYGASAGLLELDAEYGIASTGGVALLLDGEPGEYTIEVVYSGDENVAPSRTEHVLLLQGDDDADGGSGDGNDERGGGADDDGKSGAGGGADNANPKASGAQTLPATGAGLMSGLLAGLGAIAILGGAAFIAMRRRAGNSSDVAL